MTVCRASLAATVAFAAMAALQSSAAAQSLPRSGPIILFPQAPSTPAAGVAPSVAVESVDDRFPEAVGPLEPSDGGFGLDVWRGAERAGLLEQIRALPPAGPASFVLRDLMHRLLLTNARPPDGSAGSPPPSEGGLLLVRGETLEAAGDLQGTAQLLSIAPSGALAVEPVARLAVETRLLLGQDDRACDQVSAGLANFQTTFWTRAAIVCDLIRGDRSAAMVGLDLQRELDPTFGQSPFSGVAEAAAGFRDLPEQVTLDPLTLPLLRLLRQPPSGPAVAAAGLPEKVAVLADESLTWSGRLDLAEELARQRVVDGRALAAAYQEATFAPADLVAPLRANLPPASRRALLFNSFAANPGAGESLSLLGELAASARAEGLEVPLAQAVAGQIDGLAAPPPSMRPGAALVARLLLLADRYEQANLWIAAALQDGSRGGRQAALSIWPLARIAGLANRYGLTDPLAWASQARAAGLQPAAVDRTADRLTAILAVLEPAGSVAGLRPAQPPAGRLATLVIQGRLGEALLAIFDSAGRVAPQDLPTGVLADSLDALVRLGLRDQAQALAMEAMAPLQF